MKIKNNFVIILLATLVIYVALPHTGFPTLADAQKLVTKKINEYMDKKYHFRNNYQQGLLKQLKSKVITMHLYKGNKYVFIAGGCNDASDLRIQMFNERYQMVKDDNNRKNFSCFEYEAPRSGAYILKITIAKCADDGAHWCYVSGYK